MFKDPSAAMSLLVTLPELIKLVFIAVVTLAI